MYDTDMKRQLNGLCVALLTFLIGLAVYYAACAVARAMFVVLAAGVAVKM